MPEYQTFVRLEVVVLLKCVDVTVEIFRFLTVVYLEVRSITSFYSRDYWKWEAINNYCYYLKTMWRQVSRSPNKIQKLETMFLKHKQLGMKIFDFLRPTTGSLIVTHVSKHIMWLWTNTDGFFLSPFQHINSIKSTQNRPWNGHFDPEIDQVFWKWHFMKLWSEFQGMWINYRWL